MLKRLFHQARQHIFLILVVIAVGTGYYYREEIFGVATEEESGKGKASENDPSMASVATAVRQGEESTIPTTPRQQGGVIPSGKRPVEVPVTQIDNAPPEVKDITETTEIFETAQLAASEVNKRSENTSGAQSEPLKVGSMALESPLEEMAAQATYRPLKAGDTDPEQPSGHPYEGYLQKAREAYWNGEEDKAIGIYQALSQFAPEYPDPYGELGNIALKQGDSKQAAEYYLQAIAKLNRQGLKEEVSQLLSRLQQFDLELYQHLSSKLDD